VQWAAIVTEGEPVHNAIRKHRMHRIENKHTRLENKHKKVYYKA
jgi:hypothetical protein